MLKSMATAGLVAAFFILFAYCAVSSSAQDEPCGKNSAIPASYDHYVPDTVSPEAHQILRLMQGPQGLPLPAPNDIAGWKKIREYVPPQFKKIANDPAIAKRTSEMTKRYPSTSKKRNLGGVPVVEIVPQGWRDNGKVLVYTHGGGYVTGNADFGLGGWVAGETGLRIISVDYTLAPEAKWDQITNQVIAVLRALEKEGHLAKNIAILGDSAGGGLAAGAVLKMRDRGLDMPGAVVLWSPWSDITETGDTYVTLANADPILNYKLLLKKAADAYADPKDQRNPYVSPVYGDYSKGFPPTLIQGGTKEIFLSNFVRHYRAIDNAGGTAVLDLYEGMPHVFQGVAFATPEAQQAMAKMKRFLATYLGT